MPRRFATVPRRSPCRPVIMPGPSPSPARRWCIASLLSALLLVAGCGSDRAAQAPRYVYRMTVLLQIGKTEVPPGTTDKPATGRSEMEVPILVRSDMPLERLRETIARQGYIIGQSLAYYDDQGQVARSTRMRDSRRACTIIAGEKTIARIELVSDAEAKVVPEGAKQAR